MIITKQEIQETARYFQLVAQTRDQGVVPEPLSNEFFCERPHLLMPLGYDDYYGIDWEMADAYAATHPTATDPSPFPRDINDEYGRHLQSTFGLVDLWFAGEESLYRERGTGAWFWFEGITEDGRLHFVGPKSNPHRYIPIQTCLDCLTNSLSDSKESTSRLWLPQVFSPRAQIKGTEALSKSIQPMLVALKNQQMAVQDISWRCLEEIVAELLRAKGMRIHVTPWSRDGGRDIIAQGELVPGEPMLLAVEIKKKPVVGLIDVQRALKANEDFPSLMIVNSGRFSAGECKRKATATPRTAPFPQGRHRTLTMDRRLLTHEGSVTTPATPHREHIQPHGLNHPFDASLLHSPLAPIVTPNHLFPTSSWTATASPTS